MSLMQVRDDKDPQPMADNVQRKLGGNTPVTGEKHDAGKAEKVSADARFSLRTGGERQPTREAGDGNVPVPEANGEKHGQGKAERVSADRRF